MQQRRRKVPVFLRQAIRQGIGVCIAVSLGYAIVGMLGGEHQNLSFSLLISFDERQTLPNAQAQPDCHPVFCREAGQHRNAMAPGWPRT
jgi:hypothetical protein